MFQGRKGAVGASILLGIILLNIIVYIFIAAANQSSFISVNSEGSISEDKLSEINPFSWFDGFRISVFGMPNWFNYFYFTFMSAMLIIGGWYAVKGN